MRSVLFALAFAGLAAAQLSPHVGDAWESPATEYCSHSEDPAGHKCYEGCATRPFKSKGLAQPGVCNPHLFNKVTSTKKVVQCSDGATNVKYCAAPLYTVTVTQKTLGENAVEILAEASVPSMFVHQIVTSPGDHCLEITIPGGAGSPFWKANAWKYSAPDRPEWKTGACDHTKWDEVDSTTEKYDGYTAAKNSPYAAVSLNKYGIMTAIPVAEEIPGQFVVLQSITSISSIIKRVKPPCYYVGFYAECREETKAADCVDSQYVKNIHGTCAAAGYTVCCDSEGRKTWFKPGEYPPGECGRFGEKCT